MLQSSSLLYWCNPKVKYTVHRMRICICLLYSSDKQLRWWSLTFIGFPSDNQRECSEINHLPSANGKIARMEKCVSSFRLALFVCLQVTDSYLREDEFINDFWRAILVVFLVLTPSSMSNYICWIVSFPSRQSSAQGTSSNRTKRHFSLSFVRSFCLFLSISFRPIIDVNHLLCIQ